MSAPRPVQPGTTRQLFDAFFLPWIYDWHLNVALTPERQAKAASLCDAGVPTQPPLPAGRGMGGVAPLPEALTRSPAAAVHSTSPRRGEVGAFKHAPSLPGPGLVWRWFKEQ